MPHQISKVCMYVAGGSARPTVCGIEPASGHWFAGWSSEHARLTGHTSCSSSERRLTACPDAKSSKATRHPNRRCSNPGEAQTSPEATLASSERSLVFTLSKSLKRIELSALTLMSDMVMVRCMLSAAWMISRCCFSRVQPSTPGCIPTRQRTSKVSSGELVWSAKCPAAVSHDQAVCATYHQQGPGHLLVGLVRQIERAYRFERPGWARLWISHPYPGPCSSRA